MPLFYGCVGVGPPFSYSLSFSELDRTGWDKVFERYVSPFIRFDVSRKQSLLFVSDVREDSKELSEVDFRTDIHLLGGVAYDSRHLIALADRDREQLTGHIVGALDARRAIQVPTLLVDSNRVLVTGGALHRLDGEVYCAHG